MKIQQLKCPTCSAPISDDGNTKQVSCLYCDSQLEIQRQGDLAAVKLVAQVQQSLEEVSANTQARIQEGTETTQEELRHLCINQEIMAAQIRLSHVQSEIRLLERSAQSRTTHRQLAELYQQETVLNQQIISLQATLDPELQRDGGIFGTVLDDTSTTTPIWSVGCGWTVAAFVLASLIINIIPSAERFSGIIAIGIAVAVYVYFQKQVRDSLSTGKTANRSSIYSNTISNIGNPRLSRVNPSSKAITLLLCVFGLFGLAGLHRLYTGHVVIGIIQLLTMGGLMIWTLIDLVLILTGNFRDSEGRMLL